MPKPILLQGAMPSETGLLIEALADRAEGRLGCWTCFTGALDGYPAVVVQTQVGIANAAASTVLALERFSPAAVLNQGTGGGHDPALHTWDIVLGEGVVDLDRYRCGYAPVGAGVDPTRWRLSPSEVYDRAGGAFVTADTVRFPGDPALLAAAESVAGTYEEGRVVRGVIGSGDLWNNQADRILQCHELWGTSVEEMEGAAAAQICGHYGVPFLDVRVLSNSALHPGETFDPATGPACQRFALRVAGAYVAALKK